jgi:hypothetical protein
MLTAGNVSDVKAAPALLKQAGRMRYLLADRGYDADQLRRWLRDAGAVPGIPGRRSRKRAICYDKEWTPQGSVGPLWPGRMPPPSPRSPGGSDHGRCATRTLIRRRKLDALVVPLPVEAKAELRE